MLFIHHPNAVAGLVKKIKTYMIKTLIKLTIFILGLILFWLWIIYFEEQEKDD